MPALRRRINCHLIKSGVVRRRVTRVAQTTRHDMTVKDGYVAFVNEGIKSGKYRDCEIVNIDETNTNFDLVSGATLAGRSDRTVACATTGSSNRCTVLLGVTMDGEKLPQLSFSREPTRLVPRSWKSLIQSKVGANLVIPKARFTLCRPRHGWTRQGCMTGLILRGVHIPRTHVVEAKTHNF
jgi:hypothetical protein